MFYATSAPVKGAPALPDTGGTTVSAAATTNFIWTDPRRMVLLQNRTGGDWYININSSTAPTTTSYHRVLANGADLDIGPHLLITNLYIYAVSATTIDSTGKNASIYGWV